MSDQQPHTPHIEEVCSAYVQYHHFNSYGMDDSEETEKSFYRMIARIAAAAEQRGATKALRDAADALEGRLGTRGAPTTLWEFRHHLRQRADQIEQEGNVG